MNYRGALHRPGRDAFALEITLRAALSCRLPLERGLLLHSAGIVANGRAILFFGPSGAGKSTLSSLVDAPVLSDELVALRENHARATGFWGTLDCETAPKESYPISALVSLGRGHDVDLAPLSHRQIARALISVAVVPPQPPLWRAAMETIAALSQLPSYRLDWMPSQENARRLLQRLTITD